MSAIRPKRVSLSIVDKEIVGIIVARCAQVSNMTDPTSVGPFSGAYFSYKNSHYRSIRCNCLVPVVTYCGGRYPTAGARPQRFVHRKSKNESALGDPTTTVPDLRKRTLLASLPGIRERPAPWIKLRPIGADIRQCFRRSHRDWNAVATKPIETSGMR